MNRFRNGALLATVFVVGCATSQVASHFFAPPVGASTNPTRWEYLCMDRYSDAQSLQEAANLAGREGWELSGAAGGRGGPHTTELYVWCFKRPLGPDRAPGASRGQTP
ncbi:MAG: hypothetical protein MJE77_40100 [Proteobacteria bacterium]|nr:hypothetical protein [Pseudomonadota bacterium]